MKPIRLYTRDDFGVHQASAAWACSICQIVCSSEHIAENHCICSECNKVKKGMQTWQKCEKCEQAESQRRAQKCRDKEAEQLRTAEIIDDDGCTPVYDGMNYYASLDEYVDHLVGTLDLEDEWPTRVHACDKLPCLNNLDASDLIEQIVENAEVAEDYDLELDGTDKFTTAVEALKAANTNEMTWWPNDKKALFVPAREPIEHGGPGWENL